MTRKQNNITPLPFLGGTEIKIEPVRMIAEIEQQCLTLKRWAKLNGEQFTIK